MTLALALTGFDPSNPIPGLYGELRFAQGETAGDTGPRKILVMGPKTSSGTITADTQIVGPLNDEADAITYSGTGGVGARMLARIMKLNKSAAIYYIAPAVASGSAAIEIITFVTTATGNGVATTVLCGVTIQSGISSGDDVTAIALAHKNRINTIANSAGLPFTATVAAGVITVTGRIVGVELNSARIRCSVTGGIGTTVSPTSDIAVGTSGVGAAAIGTGLCDYTAALATMLATRFHYIVPHVQTAAALLALITQVNTQAEPSTGFRQVVVAGSALTPSAATTLSSGANMNKPRARLFNQEEAPEEHYMNAATCAAVVAKYETSDPSFNFDGFGTRPNDVFPIQRPFNDTGKPTVPELKSMLNNGTTPIAVATNDTCYISRSVTTFCLVGANYDYRVRDSCVVAVGDRFLDDLQAKLAAAPWTHVTTVTAAQEVSDPPLGKFATPARVRTAIESKIDDFEAAGYFDPAKLQAMITGISCGQDPLVPSAMNSIIPIYSAVQLHQHRLLVKESSPAQ